MKCINCQSELPDGSEFCFKCGSRQGAPQAAGPAATPNTSAIIPPPTATLSAEGFLPAFLGRRFANFLIDAFGIYITQIMLTIAAAFIFPVFAFIFLFFGSVVYYLFFEGLWQRTPGKWATGTKVVMFDGSKPDFMHILGRSFARLIPFEALSFLFSAHPVGWHDYLSGTMVVPAAYSADDVRRIDLSKQKSSTAGVIVAIIIGALVLFAIIGILAAVVLASLGGARTKARDAQRVLAVNELQMSLELHRSTTGTYPQSLQELNANEISSLPMDPQTEAPYDYVRCPNDSYHLGATLEEPSNSALESDADAAPLCTEDTINGSDTMPCSGLKLTGKACYDVVSSSSVDTATTTPAI
jgi:uncharacterized RDD family membrane protein YckC/type II secretory pathway pseudopilin PulG